MKKLLYILLITSMPLFAQKITIDGKDKSRVSDTTILTLGFEHRPEIYAYAEASGREVKLESQVISNPDSAKLNYFWTEDTCNPLRGTLAPSPGKSEEFVIPDDAPRGEYYYNLTVAASDGDTVRARTYVTVDSLGVIPFNIKTDHASWIDKAVIYEITPYLFVPEGKFKDITAKIPELADFGITAIWLQPINATHNGGQGYDVMDYFSLRNDLGTEEDFRELVKTAHLYDVKVIMDFMSNHTSIFHPYAEDSRKYGEKSRYWNYFQHERSPEGTPFREKEKTDDGIFWYYFWDQLPNLNYDNLEVQTWMLEALRYWIEKFDIDGYRFDAVWGVNARCPGFARKMRLALKSIKPEILLLAEDRAVWGSVFDCRFDLAFDWAEPVEWLSRWVWQTSFPRDDNPTIFNSPSPEKVSMLRASLTNYGKGYSPRAKILRYLENNDTYHFKNNHTLMETKMAAALEFSLPGVPLLYNGQEVGMKGHAYDGESFFSRKYPIRVKDKLDFYGFYRGLIKLRKSIPALYGSNYEEVEIIPADPGVFAFRRWEGKQNVFVILNMMDDLPAAVGISIPIEKLNLDTSKTYYLTDMLSSNGKSGKLKKLLNTGCTVGPKSARILLLSDTPPFPWIQ